MRREQKRLESKRKAKSPPRLPKSLEFDFAAGRAFRVAILGCGEALVENYLEIVSLTEKTVTLRVKGGLLTVSGEGLSLREVQDASLIVAGAIAEITLPKGGSL